MIAMQLGDHPRACGEHFGEVRVRVGAQGSSPRMRGTLPCSWRVGLQSGIIPAHAGNTMPVRGRPKTCQDHPRACGEHLVIALRGGLRQGSSPRMRGTRRNKRHRRGLFGIIPAHAGNTKLKKQRSNKQWDHPRACGEHYPILLGLGFASGSSPRMRGTR